METEIKTNDKTNSKEEMYDHICSPITSLEELQQCLRQPPTWANTTIKLKTRSNHVIKNTTCDCHTEDYNFIPKQRLSKDLVPRTLVCHDMKNGYLADKYLGRVNIGNGYTFYRWSQIDIFVYFSHHLITIPPLSWINLAHKNEVPILGTFITESNQGKSICDGFLKDIETLKATADSLIEICLLFKLDGWLLNIENKIEKPDNLKMFVQYLTDNLHVKQRHSYVIWYDSVTKDGDLTWQNELNEKNRCYFDVCDGIFLNYTWKEENLEKTVKEAQHRLHDVYVGLDVFGRGCFGGGKFNSKIAAEVIRDFNLSMAIFAQGWTHETLDTIPEDNFLQRFHARDDTWWNTLWPYLYSHPIKYGFETTFQIGADGMFYNLQSQSRQLTNFLSCEEIPEINGLNLLKDKCLCLKNNTDEDMRISHISNEYLPEGTNYVHRLFSTEIFLSGNCIVYCYTKSQNSDYDIVLLVQNKYKHITKIICHSNSSRNGNYNENIIEMTPTFQNPNLKKNDVPEDWVLKAFDVKFDEDVLLEIGISLIGRSSVDLCGFGITIKE